MEDYEAARVLSCWLCGGPLTPRSKPWHFSCPDCRMVIRAGNIGDLQAAIRRKIDAAGQEVPAKAAS